MNTKKLTPEQQKAIEEFTKLITYHADIETIENALDASIWAITCYKLKDNHFTGSDGAESEIYWLRTLKEVCGGRVSWPK